MLLTTIIGALLLAGTVKAASLSTLHRRENHQRQTLHRDHGTQRFFARHWWLLFRPSTAPMAWRAFTFARAEIRWTLRELAETRAQLRPVSPSWLVQAFECIHSHEGAWTDDTGNGYEGGLQFGPSEWQRYGGRFAQHAYEATPAEQIDAGIAYYRVAGFNPWPHTAAMCGLL